MPFTISKKNGLNQQLLNKSKASRKANAAKVKIKSASAKKLQNDLLPNLAVELRPINDLRPPKRKVRNANSDQIERSIKSIQAFGFVCPVTVRGNVVVDGHTRLLAARELGIQEIPCINVGHLSESEARMLAISLNRLAERGEWNLPELKLELEELEIGELDLSVSFFTEQELDIILTEEPDQAGQDDVDLEPPSDPVSRPGDLWLLGKGHRILCGNSLDAESFKTLLGDSLARAVMTDPPYNVKIAGNVSGNGKIKHGEFKFASGEMNAEQFQNFLFTVHELCANHLEQGSVVYSFMDWRSIDLLTAAAREAGLSHINTAVWYKGAGGMGSFLRSAHEFCGIFCKGDKPKVNNVELGKHGRDRTNVWVYPGANRPGTSSGEMLKDHPTPKNLEMCAEAIRDVTLRGDIVLDPFLGSGTTLMAADQTRRYCYGIELDRGYVDVCIRRWQDAAKCEAVLAASGQTFSQVAAERAAAEYEANPEG